MQQQHRHPHIKCTACTACITFWGSSPAPGHRPEGPLQFLLHYKSLRIFRLRVTAAQSKTCFSPAIKRQAPTRRRLPLLYKRHIFLRGRGLRWAVVGCVIN